MIRALVAADSELARIGLAGLLGRADGVVVVGRAATGTRLADDVRAYTPDVIVVETSGLDDDALVAWLDQLGDAAAGTPLVLVGEIGAMAPLDLVRLNVHALLSQAVAADELGAAVRLVAAGLVVLDATIVDALLGSSATAPDRDTSNAASSTATQDDALTPREIEVLNAVAEGLGNKQIAARLGISEHTVKTHLAAIFAKLDVSSRTEAVMLGARRGLILL